MNGARISRHTARLLATLTFLVSPVLYGYDPGMFYRAGFFNGEPRLTAPWLGSWTVDASHGSTTTSRNTQHQKTLLFNLYGPENFHLLGKNVPDMDPTNYLDMILTQLWMLPGDGTFGRMEFGGKFDLTEINFTYIQNLTCGFFFELFLPVKQAKTQNICSIDITPNSCYVFPDESCREWQRFLNNRDAIFARYDIDLSGVNNKGVGDFSGLLGWAFSSTDVNVLDFIDGMLMVGFLAPTANIVNPDKIFEIPLGYNGHPGVHAYASAAIGLYEWLTFSCHAAATAFMTRTRELRMKTDAYQNGLIKLAKGCARVHPGVLWQGGIAAKADHVICGISALLGYTFFKQERDNVMPLCPCPFNPAVVNTDSMFGGWKMHVLHLALEHDHTKPDSCWGWRVGLFYNASLGGKQIFDTNMVGGMLGLDAVIEF